MSVLFFFSDTATTEIYTLSLHDALPIYGRGDPRAAVGDHLAVRQRRQRFVPGRVQRPDRKSTRLNSSHTVISYAVFCLKKKKNHKTYSNNDLETHTTSSTHYHTCKDAQR